ncbi:MAG: DNA polymerase III subunit beta [Flavobacteriales bacterium]|nr:DNA polymerase III subunit beta [Flavobacteriales bacterium]
MKFIVSSSALLKQLQMLSGVLNSSNTLPILDNFLFEIKKKELTISASDLETAMTTRMAIEAKDEGTIAIPAKMLLDILKVLPDQPLTFTIDGKTYGIEIASDFGKYKLTGANGDDFPKAPAMEGAKSMTIQSGILAKAINKTLFAAGNDDMRPVMSGVFFEIQENSVRFVATDAHRLVRYTRKDIGSDTTAAFIVPRKPLNLLRQALGTLDTQVQVDYNENNALFTFDHVTLMCRLIEGKYPNYEAVIPKENPNRLTIDRADMLSSIKRVSIFANKTTHQVRLKLGGSELNLSAEDLDFANEANERLTCAYDGEDMEIGFNSKFLGDMLSNLEAENINVEMSQPNRAGILTPADGTEASEDLLMLVMPVMLNA